MSWDTFNPQTIINTQLPLTNKPHPHTYKHKHFKWLSVFQQNMASFCSRLTISLVLFVLVLGCVNAQLSTDFYYSSCPKLLSTVRSTVQSAISKETRMGASLLRLFFHDCFVNVISMHASSITLFGTTHISHNFVACNYFLSLTHEQINTGMWRFDSFGWHVKLHRGEERKPQQKFCSWIWSHWQHKISRGESVSRSCFLCGYPCHCCQRLCSNRKWSKNQQPQIKLNH